jgi:hypothetical protein
MLQRKHEKEKGFTIYGKAENNAFNVPRQCGCLPAIRTFGSWKSDARNGGTHDIALSPPPCGG